MNFSSHPLLRGACAEARDWIGSLPPETTQEQAWALCPRGDWLLWLANRAGVDRRKLIASACACARLVNDLMPPESDRALSVVEAWCRGEATDEEVRANAANAANAAANAEYAAAAYAAANAATWAANAEYAAAAYAAANAAAAATWAATWAANAANAANAAANAEYDMRRQCADVVRSMISWREVVP